MKNSEFVWAVIWQDPFDNLITMTPVKCYFDEYKNHYKYKIESNEYYIEKLNCVHGRGRDTDYLSRYQYFASEDKEKVIFFAKSFVQGVIFYRNNESQIVCNAINDFIDSIDNFKN